VETDQQSSSLQTASAVESQQEADRNSSVREQAQGRIYKLEP
jgi:hypothetical protein